MSVNLLQRAVPNEYKVGLFAYEKTFGLEDRAQLHLRVEEDGRGLLLINANRALHLNPTAAYMAWLMLEGRSKKDALRELRKRYRVSVKTAEMDFEDLQDKIEGISRPDNACPIHDLNFEVLPPLSRIPTAPYRMDLALTYRCNANCSHCYNARPRSFPELNHQSWIRVLDILWEIGVPHICFTGGEATLREDLPDLIHHADSLGQITGLLSNGRRLSNRDYVDRLASAGLEHVQITLESHDEAVHDRMVAAKGAWRETVEGIKNCLEAGLFVMTNTTLLLDNASSIGETIDFLSELGVPTVGCNALIYAGRGSSVGSGLTEDALHPLLNIVREKTSAYQQRLIWYTPTQYCHFDPTQMELGVKTCTAAMYNMCVEPDGSVIPCQSYYESLGNILEEPWDTIWNHDLSLWLRERKYVPDSCNDCEALAECGGGCPLTLKNQPDQQPITIESLPQIA